MKTVLGFLVAAQLFIAPASTLNMVETVVPEVSTEVALTKDDEVTRQEEFMWFYRVYNGKDQKRLWSITNGRWVTDWIDCD